MQAFRLTADEGPELMSYLSKARVCALTSFASACLLAGPGLAAAPASLSRSVAVQAQPAAVWAAIGPFCAIADWHPAIATCSLDDRASPTRTLLTRDGKAKFVELQLARSDADRSYSYAFTSSPVPVTHYTSTFSVKANRRGGSIVTWSSVYTPNPGQEVAADAALSDIYESGLAAIKSRLATAAASGAHAGAH